MNDIAYAGKIRKGGAESAIKYLELVLASGRGKLIWDGGSAGFSAGDIIVVPALTKRTIAGVNEDDICVRLDRFIVPLSAPAVLKDDENGGIAHACRQAVRYFGARGSSVVLLGLGALLAGYISAFSRGTELSPVVSLVKSEIDRRLSDSGFTVGAYLRTLPLSYDYLRKTFKKEVGVTPHDYIVAARMELAAEIISSRISNRYSSYTVAQIAEACGYSEPLYFSRVFKKYYGMSPKQYRDSVR